MLGEEMKYLMDRSQQYKNDLIENILPFWLENGLDKINGGFYTCVDRQGKLMDSTKSVWFQGRAAFVFSMAYNEIEPRKEWLDAAKSAVEFIEKYCIDTDGRMYFEVTAEGKPLRKRRYLFSESFAAVAMAEFSKASGEAAYAQKALDIFKLILHYKNTPGLLQPKYEAHVQTKGHSLTMILINTASRIRTVIQDEILTKQIDESIDSIRHDFLKPEFNALLETVGPNGEFIDTNIGRTINPGHAIETAWFILEEARFRNWDAQLIELGCKILDWSWEWGWDQEFGGILNFVDCKQLPPQDYAHDMKFWWPQTEAIIATLYAYLASGNKKYLEMHSLIHEYAYEKFPDKIHGEWYGYLHKDGSISQTAKGNLFKGPFHIPRMMIISHLLCNQINENIS